MLVIDVTVPSGRFTAAERRDLARRLTATELLGREGEGGARADAGVLALYESLTHVRIVEHDIWINDGEPLDEADPPRYVVDVRVGAWGKEMAAHLIKGITRAIEAFEGTEGRLTRRPRVLVHVIGLPDGAYGAFGEPLNYDAFSDLISEAKIGQADPGDGMVVDPTCGAVVPAAEAFLLERDGATYGFCCPHCRGRFAKKHKAEQAD